MLCDTVAIVKNGRLSETGRLEELRQRAGDHHHLEITVAGADAEAIKRTLTPLEGSSVASTAGGARIEVADEKDVDTVLAAMRRAGGRLVSVQPVKQSLEELFVREATEK